MTGLMLVRAITMPISSTVAISLPSMISWVTGSTDTVVTTAKLRLGNGPEQTMSRLLRVVAGRMGRVRQRRNPTRTGRVLQYEVASSHDRGCPRVHVELRVDVAQVELHRVIAERQAAADLLVADTGAEQF